MLHNTHNTCCFACFVVWCPFLLPTYYKPLIELKTKTRTGAGAGTSVYIHAGTNDRSKQPHPQQAEDDSGKAGDDSGKNEDEGDEDDVTPWRSSRAARKSSRMIVDEDSDDEGRTSGLADYWACC